MIVSFFAGMATFVSPCVLPLIPAYISFITGASLEELKNGGKSLKYTFLNALFFVLGFGAVFTLLGASATWLGNTLFDKKDILRWAGGVIVIIFGFHTTGIIRIPFLYYEKRMELKKSSLGFAGSFFVGMAFAVGWTPCVGPILSSILLLASAQDTVARGFLLLVSYSLGLGVPFLLTALFINRAIALFSKMQKYFKAIEITAGLILILVGILILTDSFNAVAGKLTSLFYK
ncbi:MAG: cytochrome c biogenesis protein CcdA [Elusimicrobiota bacterium]